MAMEEGSHIINPEGEVIIGHNPNAPFAVWNDESAQVVEPADSEKLDEVANRLPAVLNFDSDFEALNDEPANVSVNEVNSITSKADVRIQVSAKHLMLASPVFKRALTGKWKEGSTFVGTGSVETTTESWDVEAFLVLLRILHCQHHKLPKRAIPKFAAKIAVLTDYPQGVGWSSYYSSR